MKPTVRTFAESKTSNARACVIAAVLVAVGLLSSPAVASAQDIKEVTKSGEWTLYSHSGQSPMCFLTSRARESEPKGQRRAGHFYITSWPNDGVKQEISINLGAALKAQSQVDVSIGPSKFKFFAQGDKAFITNSADEAKLVAVMKKGNVLTVDATSASGTALKDKYSLIGLSQGMVSLAKGCS